jgi:hypothetical protein
LVFLYTYKTPEINSEWINFFPTNFTKGTDFNQQNFSLILFIEYKNQLYCIIGGNSFRIIQPFIEENFGVNIYSRILDPENDELLSIRTRNITGKIASSSNFYKSNFKLIDHIKFGTIPTDISLKLSNIGNDYFNFLKKESSDSVQIQVSNSVKFRKVVEFDDLIQIVKEIKYIEELEKKDYLTTYEKIENQDLIENTFKEHLVKRIFEDIDNTLRLAINPINKFYFEFCHPAKLEQFYEADYFQLIELDDEKKQKVFKEVNDRNKIYFEVISRAIDKFSTQISYEEFKFFLFGVRIRSYKNGNKQNLTSSMFLYHFNTEFEINKRPIFLLDNNWYYLQDSFLLDLNRNCERIIKNYKSPNILHKKWDLSVQNTEKKYNLLYKNLNNYLVFDTITISGIELCDIIKYDEKNIYLIHVKRGFDSSMRELYNQIILSARRLEESKSSKEKDYLKKSFQSLIKKNQNNNINSFEDFIKLFDKNIKYVMAFSNNNSNELIENNLEKVKSSIAKFSIIQTSSEMRKDYYELLFTQIGH